MQTLNIPATEVTPSIAYLAESAVLQIEGESYPENVSAFFEPVFTWLGAFLSEPRTFTVKLRVSYLNTSSTKALLDLLLLLEEHQQSGGQVEVHWHYRPNLEVMQETGEELSEDLQLPFSLIPDESM